MKVIDFQKYNPLNYSDIDEIIQYAKDNNLEFAICFKTEDIEEDLTESEEDYDVTVITMNTDITDRLDGICYVDLNKQ